MERHKQAVGTIAAAVRGFFERREPYRIAHGSTNSTRPRPRGGQHPRQVDISALSNVLSVDVPSRIALVEPNVPMDRLVESTLRHGLVPPVVMEFPGITAGGGFAGTAGESSSFRHGFFDDTVEAVEMVLASGEVVRASREERADLFRGSAGAVGTLGITTLLELRLVEARRFVKTTYHRTSSVAEAVAKIREQTARPDNDYVDGILFSKDHGVVVTGQLTNEKPADAPVQTFSDAWDPWFYRHVEDRTKALPSSAASDSAQSAGVATDYVPLAEYLFRYDRAGFWVGAAGFTYFRFVPCTRFFRWLLDDFMHTRMMYRALHGSGESARFVVQDLGLPYRSAEAFVDYTAEKFDIWPLWLCPLKQAPPPTFHPCADPDPALSSTSAANTTSTSTSSTSISSPSSAEKPRASAYDPEILNIGLWGWGPVDRAAFIAKNRDLEARLSELGGRKWLYAHTYYSEDEFWRVYDRAPYEALREKYQATTLPSVFDKVSVRAGPAAAAAGAGAADNDTTLAQPPPLTWRQTIKGMWPIGGAYGIWKSILSGDYHLHRNAEWKYKGEGAAQTQNGDGSKVKVN